MPRTVSRRFPPVPWLAGLLRAARISAHLSVLDLARALSISTSTVERWEAGQSDIAHAKLLDLAMTTHVDVRAFLSEPSK